MRGFLGGVVVTLLVVLGGAYLVLYLGLFPIGADNPPGVLERRLAHAGLVVGSRLAGLRVTL